MEKSIKLVAFDMDGTVLDSKLRLPKGLFEMIESHPNVKFVVASGRQYYSLLNIFNPIKDKLIFISENGGIIMEKDKVIHIMPVPDAKALEVLDLVSEDKGIYPVLGCEKTSYIENPPEYVMNDVAQYNVRLETVDDIKSVVGKDNILNLALYCHKRAKDNILPKLADISGDLKAVLSAESWVDVINANVNKGNAIKVIQDIYGISVSDSTVSRITDKILPIVKEWQQRPLEPIYAVVFLDAIHYHVRSEGQIVKKAVYIAIGIDLDGRKDVLGMWVGENESAKFWATVLNGLRNRGVEDIFIACTDNLAGFDAAIHATFPQTEIQNCIIHQLRNSSKYVSYKDLKALMADLKAVYAAVDEQAALDALDTFGEHWDRKYPKISQSWRDNWANLSTYFKYPQEVRRLIYTTNAIEGFNRQLRKVTKAKSVFPTDDSLLKMLYLAMMDITKKWTGRRQDWSVIHAQMAVYFAERMPE